MKAIDLIKQLNKDPEFVKTQELSEKERQEKFLEIKNIETPFIEDLYANGFPEIESAGDLLKLKEVSDKLVDLILKWLPNLTNKYNSKEMLVRGLVKAKNPFDGKILIQLFDSSDSTFSLKWAIANTIATAKAQNITSWLEDKLNKNQQPREHEMLVYAVIKYFPYEKASLILRSLFKTFPLQVADAFTYVGKANDLNYLIENSTKKIGAEKKEVDKAIKKLQKKIR